MNVFNDSLTKFFIFYIFCFKNIYKLFNLQTKKLSFLNENLIICALLNIFSSHYD